MYSKDAVFEFRTGWHLLLLGMIGCGLGVTSLPLYTTGVFFQELESSFGWTRAQLSSSVLFFTMSLAVASPLMGYVVDRLGVKLAVTSSIILASSCYVLLSISLSSLWQFYLLHVLIASLGAAAAPLAYTRLVTAHFRHARGLALGITLMGPSIVAALAPVIVATVIKQSGWSGGYLALSLGLALVLPVLLFVRTDPVSSVSTAANPIAYRSPYTKHDIRKIFITLFIGLGLFSLGVGGLIIHLVPMLTDSGISQIEAASVAGLIGVSGIVGRIAGGVLADHVFAPYVLIFVGLSAATGCAALVLYGPQFAAFAAIAIGFSLGAEADLMGFLVAKYFGPESYGRVFGWQYAVFIIGVGIGPIFMGALYDIKGNYDLAIVIAIALLISATLVFSRLPSFKD